MTVYYAQALGIHHRAVLGVFESFDAAKARAYEHTQNSTRPYDPGGTWYNGDGWHNYEVIRVETDGSDGVYCGMYQARDVVRPLAEYTWEAA